MKKRYSIKKKRKTISTLSILLIILTVSISVSTAYSLYSTKFNIVGTVTAKKDGSGGGDIDLPTEESASTAKWNITNSWTNNGELGAQFSVKLTNLDGDITGGWTVSIDLPKELSDLQIWNVAEKEIVEVGDCKRLTISSGDGWNGNVANGAVLDIGFLAYFQGVQIEDMFLKNLVINGKLVVNLERDETMTING